MKLQQLAEVLAKDPRVGHVTVRHEREYRAAEGYETLTGDSVTVSLSRRGEPVTTVVLDPGFLRLGQGENVLGATLAVDKPYWAVQAVQRALEIDP